MSVLKFPRLYFRGLASWDPGVVNNNPGVYDAANVKILLPTGVTFDTFKQWVIDNPAGNWNYYGTHTCQFDVTKTLITGGVMSPNGNLISDDPIIGKPIQFQGKLVDLNPASISTSQIFFDSFAIGDQQTGISANSYHRFHSRWINFRRNLGGLPIAGNAAVVWQTVFPLDKFTLTNEANSPLLTCLEQAVGQGDAQGLMVRFSVYRTLYFQNGILNDIPQQPRNIQQLHDLYRQGLMFSNPAYSLVAGVIGVWNRGELASVPGGRYLIPSTPVKPTNAAPSINLGPCVAELDRPSKLLSLDFNSTIPEIDISLTKADFGPLTLAIRDGGGSITPVAEIAPPIYAREAYEASAGIIDIPVPAKLMAKIDANQLILQVQQAGNPVVAMTESEFVAQADERDTYLNEASPKDIKLHVTLRAKRAKPSTRVLLARYDANGNRLPASIAPPQILKVDADGTATLSVNPQAPGFLNVGMFPFKQGDPEPTPPPQLNSTIMTSFFLSLRTLPFDNEFEANTLDSQITWKFVYENILRVYDLINPVMASPSIGLPLFDKSVWTNPATAQLLKTVTAESNFENFSNMPVTRDLSAGMRKLLHRFCDLVISGTLPPDTAEAVLKPQPDFVPLVDIRRDL